MEYSKTERAEQLLGLRPPGDAVLAPPELGYRCPVCKNALIVKDEYDERLTWSEYNAFLWCSVCNRDFPSCLCLEDIGRAIEVFLDSVAGAVQYSYRKSLKQQYDDRTGGGKSNGKVPTASNVPLHMAWQR